jgi:hypothetical protein
MVWIQNEEPHFQGPQISSQNSAGAPKWGSPTKHPNHIQNSLDHKKRTRRSFWKQIHITQLAQDSSLSISITFNSPSITET